MLISGLGISYDLQVKNWASREILTVDRTEAENGARATGFTAELYSEEVDHRTLELLERLSSKSNSHYPVKQPARSRDTQKTRSTRDDGSAALVPQGWLLCDQVCLGSERQDPAEGHTVTLSSFEETPFRLEAEPGWLLAG